VNLSWGGCNVSSWLPRAEDVEGWRRAYEAVRQQITAMGKEVTAGLAAVKVAALAGSPAAASAATGSSGLLCPTTPGAALGSSVAGSPTPVRNLTSFATPGSVTGSAPGTPGSALSAAPGSSGTGLYSDELHDQLFASTSGEESEARRYLSAAITSLLMVFQVRLTPARTRWCDAFVSPPPTFRAPRHFAQCLLNQSSVSALEPAADLGIVGEIGDVLHNVRAPSCQPSRQSAVSPLSARVAACTHHARVGVRRQ